MLILRDKQRSKLLAMVLVILLSMPFGVAFADEGGVGDVDGGDVVESTDTGTDTPDGDDGTTFDEGVEADDQGDVSGDVGGDGVVEGDVEEVDSVVTEGDVEGIEGEESESEVDVTEEEEVIESEDTEGIDEEVTEEEVIEEEVKEEEEEETPKTGIGGTAGPVGEQKDLTVIAPKLEMFKSTVSFSDRIYHGERGLAGVSVTLEHLSTGEIFETVTDGNGDFTFDDLYEGKYKITLVREGFRDQVFEMEILAQ